MTGNQWQYVAVFVLLAAIVVWICYNLFSKKRRSRMSQCPGCSMNNVCHKEFRPKQSDVKGKCPSCCSDSEDNH